MNTDSPFLTDIALSSSVPFATTRWSWASVMKGGYSGKSVALFGSMLQPPAGGGTVGGVGEGEEVAEILCC